MEVVGILTRIRTTFVDLQKDVKCFTIKKRTVLVTDSKSGVFRQTISDSFFTNDLAKSATIQKRISGHSP